MDSKPSKDEQELDYIKLEEPTGLSIDKIFGQDHIKKELQNMHIALSKLDLYSQLGAKLTKGYLFVGKPGTGKTLSAKAVASDTTAKIAYIKVSDVVSNLADGRAVNLKKLIKQIEKRSVEHPIIVIFDEIDYLLSNRTKLNTSDSTLSAVNLLLEWMDGIIKNYRIIVIGCTNLIENIDPAFLRSGRFEKKLIFNDLTPEDITNIIESNIDDILEIGSPIVKKLTTKQKSTLLQYITEQMDGNDVNGADAKFCVENCVKNKTIELIEKYNNIEEVMEAINSSTASVINTDDIIREFDAIIEMNLKTKKKPMFEKLHVMG